PSGSIHSSEVAPRGPMLRHGPVWYTPRMLILTMAAAVAVLAAQTSTTPSQDDLSRMTPEQLKSGIQNAHPATYYVLATKLLASGQKDDAVFWYYARQLPCPV